MGIPARDKNIVKSKFCHSTFKAKQAPTALHYHLEKVEKIKIKKVMGVSHHTSLS